MYLTIFTGPMFSGKTTHLIEMLNKNDDKKCLYINHSIDTRTSDVFSSHNKDLRLSDNVDKKKVNILSTLDINSYDIIGIDECQFFWDLYSFLKKYANRNVHILLAGLYADSNLEKFGDLLSCFPMADELHIFTSKCIGCKKDTLHTRKKSEEKTQINVGGEEMYNPMCKKCFE